MTPLLSLTVYGTPATQGSKRHVGGGRMIESNAVTLRPWRAAIAAEARHGLGTTPPVLGPVAVSAVFTLPRPASRAKRDRWPDRKPDLDKLARALLDALSDGGVWHDDAQVVRLILTKVYVGDPLALPTAGVEVLVTVVEAHRAAELDRLAGEAS